MATTYSIAARTHGRYLVAVGPPERLLVGVHGYGENAEGSLAEMLKIPASSSGPSSPSRPSTASIAAAAAA